MSSSLASLARQPRLRARRSRRGMPLLRRLSDHALLGNRRTVVARAAARRRRLHPDGGRDRLARRRHRRLARRRQGDDRHQRARLFADAGESRLRRDDRDAVRHRQRDARRPLDRHADAAGARRHHAGAMGNPRRSPDHRRDPGLGAGDLHGDHSRLQSRRGIPHAGRRALRRNRRASHRVGRDSRRADDRDASIENGRPERSASSRPTPRPTISCRSWRGRAKVCARMSPASPTWPTAFPRRSPSSPRRALQRILDKIERHREPHRKLRDAGDGGRRRRHRRHRHRRARRAPRGAGSARRRDQGRPVAPGHALAVPRSRGARPRRRARAASSCRR